MRERTLTEISSWGMSIKITTWGDTFAPQIDLIVPEHNFEEGLELSREEATALAEGLKSAVEAAEEMVKEET